MYSNLHKRSFLFCEWILYTHNDQFLESKPIQWEQPTWKHDCRADVDIKKVLKLVYVLYFTKSLENV